MPVHTISECNPQKARQKPAAKLVEAKGTLLIMDVGRWHAALTGCEGTQTFVDVDS